MRRSRKKSETKYILRVGTDCSGIEAPIQALKNLKIPFRHVFSSEIDKGCISTIKANYTPEKLFGDTDGPYPEGDIRKRDIKDVPEIDMYICGFPCQPFSVAGKHRGEHDERGDVFRLGCMRVIRARRPEIIVLENVPPLLTIEKGATWARMLRALSRGGEYTVRWAVLNPTSFGLPQNRPRLYIIGRRNGPVSLPEPMPLIKTASDFSLAMVDPSQRVLTPFCRAKLPKLRGAVFADMYMKPSSKVSNPAIAPCIMSKGLYWNVQRGRLATKEELLGLQGFPITLEIPGTVTRARRQIGNSMAVPVVQAVFKALLGF